MAGYTRNDTSNNIADGNIINASDLDGEFDAIQTAFGVSGHTHDGTAGNGPQIGTGGLANLSVTNAKIAASAITGDKINTATTITAAGFTGPLSGNASTATKLQTTRNIELSGAVTGSVNFDGSGNVVINTTATSDPTLTLTGDVTGSATFTNLGNATLTAVVANDSHTHDGRYYTESEADSRFVNASGDTINGQLNIRHTNVQLNLVDSTYSDHYWQLDHQNGALAFRYDGNASADFTINENGTATFAHTVTAPTFSGALSGNASTASSASSAAKWTTARTLSLTGDVTGSVSLDGSANASITATVANDSHSHSNYIAKNSSWTWTSGQLSFRSADAIESSSSDQATLEVYQDTAGADAFMQFHVAGDYATYFGLDGSTNDFAVGGWSMGNVKHKVWHAGNDGSGSGLDADLLDGVQGSSYLRSDTSDTFTSLSGTSISLGSGVNLRESTDRADLLTVESQTSGWAGIQIDNTATETLWSLMADGTTFGIYDDTSNAWMLQCIDGSETRLYYAGSEKLNTTSSGIEVTGNITGVVDLYVDDQIFSTGDTNTYLQFHAADQWRVVTGGSERLEVNNSYVTVNNAQLDVNSNALVSGVVGQSTTSNLKVPVGTTAQRGTATAGSIRYNSDLSTYEGYNGSAWGSIGGGATGGSSDNVFWENDTIITASYAITSGKNAGTFGPVTIADGVVVQIPDGSTWTIV